jgi:hypothetical protein
MTGNLDMGSNKITYLADPTSSQDAATKSYVDTNQGSLSCEKSTTVMWYGQSGCFGSYPSEDYCYVMASCPSGTVLTGGGCSVGPWFNYEGISLQRTNPYDNRWDCVWTLDEGGPTANSYVSEAICCKIE